MSCEAIQDAWTELALARDLERPDAGLREHAATCAGCSAHVGFLRALVSALEALDAVPAVRPSALASAQKRALRALRAQAPPPHLARQLAGALGLALLALPVVLGHAWLVARGAEAVLAPWLPSALLTWLGFVYFGSLALAVGTLYAAIPLALAATHRRPAEVA